MAKARNIYGVGIETLPRSRLGQQRLLTLIQPLTGQIETSAPLSAVDICRRADDAAKMNQPRVIVASLQRQCQAAGGTFAPLDENIITAPTVDADSPFYIEGAPGSGVPSRAQVALIRANYDAAVTRARVAIDRLASAQAMYASARAAAAAQGDPPALVGEAIRLSLRMDAAAAERDSANAALAQARSVLSAAERARILKRTGGPATGQFKRPLGPRAVTQVSVPLPTPGPAPIVFSAAERTPGGVTYAATRSAPAPAAPALVPVGARVVVDIARVRPSTLSLIQQALREPQVRQIRPAHYFVGDVVLSPTRDGGAVVQVRRYLFDLSGTPATESEGPDYVYNVPPEAIITGTQTGQAVDARSQNIIASAEWLAGRIAFPSQGWAGRLESFNSGRPVGLFRSYQGTPGHVKVPFNTPLTIHSVHRDERGNVWFHVQLNTDGNVGYMFTSTVSPVPIPYDGPFTLTDIDIVSTGISFVDAVQILSRRQAAMSSPQPAGGIDLGRTSMWRERLQYPNTVWGPQVFRDFNAGRDVQVGDTVRVPIEGVRSTRDDRPLSAADTTGYDLIVTQILSPDRFAGYAYGVIRPSGQLDQYGRDPAWLERSKLLPMSAPRASIIHLWRGGLQRA